MSGAQSITFFKLFGSQPEPEKKVSVASAIDTTSKVIAVASILLTIGTKTALFLRPGLSIVPFGHVGTVLMAADIIMSLVSNILKK